MIMTREQIEAFLQTEEAQQVKLLIAYAIDKTPTEKDNEVVAEAGEYADLIAEFLTSTEEADPSDKEAIAAAMKLAKKIASLTETPWDDRILNAIDWVV